MSSLCHGLLATLDDIPCSILLFCDESHWGVSLAQGIETTLTS